MDNQIGRYRLLEKIGEGGMAEVFLAKAEGPGGFERLFIIKKIKSQLIGDKRIYQSFVNEARLGGQLQHHNIVQVFEFMEIDNHYFIVMEYVKGVTLEEVIKYCRENSRKVPFEIVLATGIQICEGLNYAHTASSNTGVPLNIVHRDIKPSNIMIDIQGTVKITDFGIAKASLNYYTTQTTGVVKGTIAYMSPEQVRGDPVDRRTDIFSAGATLYELLTLKRLFDASSLPTLIDKIKSCDIHYQIQNIRLGYPEFVPIIEKALSFDLDSRYQWAEEMKSDMKKVYDRISEPLPLRRFVQEIFNETRQARSDASTQQARYYDISGKGNEKRESVESPLHRFDPYKVRPSESEISPPLPPLSTTPKSKKRVYVAGIIFFIILLSSSAIIYSFIGRKNAIIEFHSKPEGATLIIDGKEYPQKTPAVVQFKGKGGEGFFEIIMEGYERHKERFSYSRGDSKSYSISLIPVKKVEEDIEKPEKDLKKEETPTPPSEKRIIKRPISKKKTVHDSSIMAGPRIRVVTNTGTVMEGRVIKMSSDRIVLHLDNGKSVSILNENIKSTEELQ